MAEKKASILKLSPEAKVGLFVLLGIVLLVYMSLRVGGIRLGGAEGYTLYVTFDSAAGLDKDSSVRVAGVEVGRVKEIQLKDSKALLTLQIRPEVVIRKDFTAVLTTKGLLGEKYLELIPGSPNAPPMEEGQEITRTTSYADMDKLITILSDVSGDIKNVTRTLSDVLGGPEGEASLRNIIRNIEEISVRVNRMIAVNDERLGDIIANLADFTALLREEGPEISKDLRLAVNNLNESLVKTSENLNQLIEENRGNLREGVENLKIASVKLERAMDEVNNMVQEVSPEVKSTVGSVGSIAKKIDEGQGTIGKLVNDPETHDNLNKTITGINSFIEQSEKFHTYVGYRGEYLFDAEDAKSYFSLRIQPKSDKYYLLEVVDDPRGFREEETREVTTGGVTTTTTEVRTEDEFEFSAQIAKRFSNLTVRGGLIESSGGVGVDYYMFGDRVKFSLEAFDFDDEMNPHMKAWGTIYFSRFFYLTAGYDDFISEVGMESAFLGLGFEFRDDDLKFLLTNAPPVSF